MTVGVAGQGGKVLVDCQCGGQIDIAAGPAATCSACGRAMPSMSIAIGHDTVIKAGDGPRGASITITGGVFGPGSVVRG